MVISDYSLIGICGKKQVGKDTIAKIINWIAWGNKHNTVDNAHILQWLQAGYFGRSRWEVKSYANKLKQSLGLILGVDYRNFNEEAFKEENSKITNQTTGKLFTNRELLQTFGTEVGRNIDPDIWIKALFNNYIDGMDWIISDVRRENEANAIRDRGGLLIHVLRDTGFNDTHISECGLDNYKFDLTIDNNSTMGSLISKVKDLYGNK